MKRPKASTVPDQEAGTGADVGCMFAHFGIPAELHTNQNRNLGVTQRRLSFTGKAKGWCNTMNIPSPHSWCGCHNCLVTLSAMVRHRMCHVCDVSLYPEKNANVFHFVFQISPSSVCRSDQTTLFSRWMDGSTQTYF